MERAVKGAPDESATQKVRRSFRWVQQEVVSRHYKSFSFSFSYSFSKHPGDGENENE
jgi:hypothetical protein